MIATRISSKLTLLPDANLFKEAFEKAQAENEKLFEQAEEAPAAE